MRTSFLPLGRVEGAERKLSPFLGFYVWAKAEDNRPLLLLLKLSLYLLSPAVVVTLATTCCSPHPLPSSTNSWLFGPSLFSNSCEMLSFRSHSRSHLGQCLINQLTSVLGKAEQERICHSECASEPNFAEEKIVCTKNFLQNQPLY